MFKHYKGLSHTVFFIILVLLASCKPVYHLAKVEKSSQSVQPGAIDTKVDQSIAPYRNQLTEAMEAVIRFTDWTTELALEVYEEEPPITKEELEILHSLDPNKVYTEEYLLTKTLF